MNLPPGRFEHERLCFLSLRCHFQVNLYIRLVLLSKWKVHMRWQSAIPDDLLLHRSNHPHHLVVVRSEVEMPHYRLAIWPQPLRRELVNDGDPARSPPAGFRSDGRFRGQEGPAAQQRDAERLE